jgi:hypothetical protein
VAYRITKDRDDAEDVIQEAFEAVERILWAAPLLKPAKLVPALRECLVCRDRLLKQLLGSLRMMRFHFETSFGVNFLNFRRK